MFEHAPGRAVRPVDVGCPAVNELPGILSRGTAVLTSAGVPAPLAEVLVDVDEAISRGLLAGTPGDPSRLTGRPTTPIAGTVAASPAGQSR
ncbi:hypothetical protein GCM10027615_23810 [Plantactinospora veratri]